jgi:hypothetical protein
MPMLWGAATPIAQAHSERLQPTQPSGSSPSAWSDPQVPPHRVGANLGHHERELHGCHFPRTMFRKQVSRPGGRSGFLIVAAEPSKSTEAKKELVTAPIRVSVPYRASRSSIPGGGVRRGGRGTKRDPSRQGRRTRQRSSSDVPEGRRQSPPPYGRPGG